MREDLLILSEDAVFSRMLELELRMRMISVRVSRREESCVGIPVVLVDLDTSPVPPFDRDTRVIGFTRSDAVSSVDPDRHCSMILHRPFEIRRLTEEVQALILHSKEERRDTLVLSLVGEKLFFGNSSVSLSPKERAVTECLLSHRGEAVKKDRISEVIGESEANKVEVYICHLRKKLEMLTKHATVRTIRGVGYRLEEY